MLKKLVIVWLVLLNTLKIGYGQIKAGPMIGHTELRSSTLWIQFAKKQNINNVQYSINLHYLFNKNQSKNSDEEVEVEILDEKNKIVLVHFNNLQPGSTYLYSIKYPETKIIEKTIIVNRKKVKKKIKTTNYTNITGNISTQELWQYRYPSPNFSFLTGSCNYFNQPKFDRPGKPYGQDSSIFKSMAKEVEANFMLWLGDNWYYREVDYFSEWGLFSRPDLERSQPIIQPLLKRIPQYAIWDDHDYGNNDGDLSFTFKKKSREIFKKFWANPSFGQNNEGIYTQFVWNDVAFFLLDDRSFRANDNMLDSINNQPNTEKTMLGKIQLNWLKNALLNASKNFNISFKIIVLGSQVLNPVSPYDCYKNYSAERQELFDFIHLHKIEGVVFLTGDRHHSEIIKIERPNAYPFFDITSSPLTSGTHKFSGTEENNPYRVLGIDKIQNYSLIKFAGDKKNRTMQVFFKDIHGDEIKRWQIGYSDLMYISEPK